MLEMSPHKHRFVNRVHSPNKVPAVKFASVRLHRYVRTENVVKGS